VDNLQLKEQQSFYQSHRDRIQEHFDKIAPERDQWLERNRYYYDDIESLYRFVIPQGSRVLEIGCGTGQLLHALQPSYGLGIDLSPALITQARTQYPDLHFEVMDVASLEVDEPFDYVVLAGTVGYLADVQQAFKQLHRVCAPQTRIIITHYSYLWQPLLNWAERIGQRMPQPAQNWLSQEDLKNLLALTGFEVIRQGARFIAPKKVPFIATAINRYLGRIAPFDHLGLTSYVIARPAYFQPETSIDHSYSVSVVIPARNEEGNIENALRRLPAMGSKTEVIFVEGNSTDHTWDEIQRVAEVYKDRWDISCFKQAGKGKADAVRKGFAHAKGDILMILDADLTAPPEDLPKFYEALATGRCEFANGSRLVYPRSYEAMPWLNTVANKFFGLVFSYLLDQPFKDTLCGTKVLWRRDYERIVEGRSYFGDFDPFGDFDLLFGAAKLNLKILDVPVRYQEREYGSSNIAHFREGLILLKMCAYASQKIKFI
jgi:ubiquinone/menaquinone biosynthesis C-methylase UbiE